MELLHVFAGSDAKFLLETIPEVSTVTETAGIGCLGDVIAFIFHIFQAFL